jgi:hypothetical protein
MVTRRHERVVLQHLYQPVQAIVLLPFYRCSLIYVIVMIHESPQEMTFLLLYLQLAKHT